MAVSFVVLVHAWPNSKLLPAGAAIRFGTERLTAAETVKTILEVSDRILWMTSQQLRIADNKNATISNLLGREWVSSLRVR
jgi:hypothetical protein